MMGRAIARRRSFEDLNRRYACYGKRTAGRRQRSMPGFLNAKGRLSRFWMAMIGGRRENCGPCAGPWWMKRKWVWLGTGLPKFIWMAASIRNCFGKLRAFVSTPRLARARFVFGRVFWERAG